ncbi:cryptochrome/photolyase family protein [Chthonobacter rhizosphaerae]|uniref:cryptochrome/photolyase family protein n=1 Tax=Chthonobacter rhizosphaerae TaxID=2735553 RepID=UPI0015EEFB00|nr:deoxyribodipyrimidine photo-lyase [Chthonobacter rhizosphaerae]
MGGRQDRDGTPVVVWFRDDLRLADNPALSAAAALKRPIVALHVLDETPGRRPIGGASRWWLHHSLDRLGADLAARGVRLVLARGPEADVVPGVVAEARASAIHWNRRYGAEERATDAALKERLRTDGVTVESHSGNLLVEPWDVAPRSGGSFKVFTPYWKAARAAIGEAAPLPVPDLTPSPAEGPDGVPLAALRLLPRAPDWAGGLRDTWQPGEAGAAARLRRFLEKGLPRYAARRDEPAADAVSMLSPHLRHGEISVRTVRQAVLLAGETKAVAPLNAAKFDTELGWREFSYHLLFHHPDLPTRNFQSRFDGFGWRPDTEADLKAWQAGRTGYPIVDAGMRQLWATGFMHNRVRMITASFLIKHLLIDWRIGEDWFFDTLVDADPASNAAGWQWVAGSGADAAPFFRVFNPMLQGEKFDPDGAYVRRWVPELAGLSRNAIHRPWTVPGDHRALYPDPIVDHAHARDRALTAFGRLRAAA